MTKLLKLTGAATALLSLSIAGTALANATVDESLPTYEPTSGLSGGLKGAGSDTLNNLMAVWMEAFEGFYPGVETEYDGKGSSTAPVGLTNGTSDLGPMSRAMKASEIDDFKAKFGYEPTEIPVAVDALAVFVHKDNPIDGLTLAQVQEIFSIEGSDSITWGDVGVTDPEFADQAITLYGRNSASGTYGYFQKVGLGESDYKPSVKEQPGSSGVINGVANDKFAIGYSGIGYATADVRAVPLSADDGEPFVEATADNAYVGDYPLARFLYIYANVPPNGAPTKKVGEFLKMVLSKQGQAIVAEDGYYPLPARIVENSRAKLGE